MRVLSRHKGFSLAEVVLAIGTLAIGMLFVAGVFPVALSFSVLSNERTVAALAADEAFAKINVFAVGEYIDSTGGGYYENDDVVMAAIDHDNYLNFNDPNCFPAVEFLKVEEFDYPSTDPYETTDGSKISKQYCWSAICKRIQVGAASDPNDDLVDVTVFVCRRTPGASYHKADSEGNIIGNDSPRPMPVKVILESDAGLGVRELKINAAYDVSLVNEGATLIDDETGKVARVLKRYALDTDGDGPSQGYRQDVVKLDSDWGGPSVDFWVVPGPINGGRNPVIGVFQKQMSFVYD